MSVRVYIYMGYIFLFYSEIYEEIYMVSITYYQEKWLCILWSFKQNPPLRAHPWTKPRFNLQESARHSVVRGKSSSWQPVPLCLVLVLNLPSLQSTTRQKLKGLDIGEMYFSLSLDFYTFQKDSQHFQ